MHPCRGCSGQWAQSALWLPCDILLENSAASIVVQLVLSNSPKLRAPCQKAQNESPQHNKHSRKWLPGIGTVSYRPFTQSIYWKLESRNLIGQSRKANWCFELQFARADTLRERAPISHPFWIPRSQTIVKKTVFALYFFNRQLR